jgi:predicted metal-dependent phosphotriesterase family hydrolase
MRIQTVTGVVPIEDIQLADGHGHVWIDPPEDVAPDARLVLDDRVALEDELKDFRDAGGTLVVDCQPGGCGRDARMLARLAEATGVSITATTGYHRQKYYPATSWLWSASEGEAAAYFVEELSAGTRETDGTVPATTIKVGYEGTLEDQGRVLIEAAAEAARQTGAPILCHTEEGRNAEALPLFFEDRGVPADRLYFCHMDKRPDIGLHRELAQAGVLLGYDTFVRPKYRPDQTTWPLIKEMVADGLGHRIGIGLDLARPHLLRRYGGEPGLLALPEQIVPRLQAEGISKPVIAQLTGQNVAQRLVRQTPEN